MDSYPLTIYKKGGYFSSLAFDKKTVSKGKSTFIEVTIKKNWSEKFAELIYFCLETKNARSLELILAEIHRRIPNMIPVLTFFQIIQQVIENSKEHPIELIDILFKYATLQRVTFDFVVHDANESLKEYLFSKFIYSTKYAMLGYCLNNNLKNIAELILTYEIHNFSDWCKEKAAEQNHKKVLMLVQTTDVEQRKQKTFLEKLPLEILFEIFNYLDTPAVKNMRLVARQYRDIPSKIFETIAKNKIAKNELFWQKKINDKLAEQKDYNIKYFSRDYIAENIELFIAIEQSLGLQNKKISSKINLGYDEARALELALYNGFDCILEKFIHKNKEAFYNHLFRLTPPGSRLSVDLETGHFSPDDILFRWLERLIKLNNPTCISLLMNNLSDNPDKLISVEDIPYNKLCELLPKLIQDVAVKDEIIISLCGFYKSYKFYSFLPKDFKKYFLENNIIKYYTDLPIRNNFILDMIEKGYQLINLSLITSRAQVAKAIFDTLQRLRGSHLSILISRAITEENIPFLIFIKKIIVEKIEETEKLTADEQLKVKEYVVKIENPILADNIELPNIYVEQGLLSFKITDLLPMCFSIFIRLDKFASAAKLIASTELQLSDLPQKELEFLIDRVDAAASNEEIEVAAIKKLLEDYQKTLKQLIIGNKQKVVENPNSPFWRNRKASDETNIEANEIDEEIRENSDSSSLER